MKNLIFLVVGDGESMRRHISTMEGKQAYKRSSMVDLKLGELSDSGYGLDDFKTHIIVQAFKEFGRP